MKILFITHKFFPDIGGIEVNSEILANQFFVAGHDVRVLTWTSQSGGRNFLFPVIRSPRLGTIMRQHIWADVVYENNPCLRLAWPAVLLRKRSVVAIRTWIRRGNGRLAIQDRLKFLWLRRAKEVIAISEKIRACCWPAATVIGNPYRAQEFRMLTDVSRNRDFAFLGRLVSDKGADMAINALHLLHRMGSRYQDVTLTVIGDGPERSAIEQLVSGLGLTSRVRLMGALRGEELIRTLNEHRFLWVPSRWEEPFGNVALEGMACGCIPIVADGGGLPDAVGRAGLVFKRNDVTGLVQCSLDLLNDAGKEATLRAAADAHLANHRPQVVAKRYLEVIESAIS